MVTTLDEVSRLLPQTLARITQLERPQKVVDFLKVTSNSEDLVNDILHTDDPESAEGFLDDSIVSKRDALSLDLAVATLVDELTNALEVRVAGGGEGRMTKR